MSRGNGCRLAYHDAPQLPDRSAEKGYPCPPRGRGFPLPSGRGGWGGGVASSWGCPSQADGRKHTHWIQRGVPTVGERTPNGQHAGAERGRPTTARVLRAHADRARVHLLLAMSNAAHPDCDEEWRSV